MVIIDHRSIWDRDREINEIGQAVIDYLLEIRRPVDAPVLMITVATRHRCSEDLVAEGISRIADRLVWDYTRGPVRLSLSG